MPALLRVCLKAQCAPGRVDCSAGCLGCERVWYATWWWSASADQAATRAIRCRSQGSDRRCNRGTAACTVCRARRQRRRCRRDAWSTTELGTDPFAPPADGRQGHTDREDQPGNHKCGSGDCYSPRAAWDGVPAARATRDDEPNGTASAAGGYHTRRIDEWTASRSHSACTRHPSFDAEGSGGSSVRP